MLNQSDIDDLLDRWESAVEQGCSIPVEELCQDCPELISLVQRQIDALRLFEQWAVPSASCALTGATPNQRPGHWQAGMEPVDGYQLLAPLGAGGFGEVWKAKGPGDFTVALKMVRLDRQAADSEIRSLEVMRVVRHPNLLATFGAWQLPSWLIIANELGDKTLADRLDEVVAQGHAGIPGGDLGHYMLDAAKGVDFLNREQHELTGGDAAGVQHRDIKPQNLLMVGGCVKIADFGLAQFLKDRECDHTGSMSVAYAAPEFFDKRTSQHSDQYSLAITYCQLRGGRLPFVGTPPQIMRGHLSESPDLSMLPEVERPIVDRALAKTPTNRWPSCRQFVRALLKTQLPARDSTREQNPNVADSPPPVAPPVQPLQAHRDEMGRETETDLASTIKFSFDGLSSSHPRTPNRRGSRRQKHIPKIASLVLSLLFGFVVITGILVIISQRSESTVGPSRPPEDGDDDSTNGNLARKGASTEVKEPAQESSKSNLGKIIETNSVPTTPPLDATTYSDLARPGFHLVGVRLTTGRYGSGYRGKAVASIQPIYRNSTGKTETGHVHGMPKDDAKEIVAKNGFAVGALKIALGGNSRIIGIRIQFMRVIDNRLDPIDSYWSPAYLREGDDLIESDGRPVVGMKGSWAKQEHRSIALLIRDPVDG